MINTIDIDDKEKLLTVQIEQDITVETADDLDRQLMQHLQDRFGYSLRLDLSKVRYMDSYGMGWLARLRQFLLSRNGSVWLVNISSTVKKTLQITGFLSLFTRSDS